MDAYRHGRWPLRIKTRLTTLCKGGWGLVRPWEVYSWASISCISSSPVYRTSSATWLTVMSVRLEMTKG